MCLTPMLAECVLKEMDEVLVITGRHSKLKVRCLVEVSSLFLSWLGLRNSFETAELLGGYALRPGSSIGKEFGHE